MHLQDDGGAVECRRELTLPIGKVLLCAVRLIPCLPRPTHVPHSLTAALYMTGSDFVYIGDESGTVQVVNFTKPLSLAMYKIAPTDTGA